MTLEPWYVKLNPKAYVPTMLVHPNNTPVCESKVIIEYIENNFEGTKSLSPGADATILERYNKFISWHDNWDVEIFSIGFMAQNHFLMNKMFRVGQGHCLWTSMEKITDPKLRADKIKALVERSRDCLVNAASTRPPCLQSLTEMLDQIEAWMDSSQNEKCFALGNDTYSIADVYLTVILGRTYIDQKYFEKEVLGRKNINKYFQRMKARPSYSEIVSMRLPNSFLVITLVNIILYGIF